MTTTVPCCGCVLPSVNVFGSPATWLASPARVPVRGLFSLPEAESFAAVMASGVTVKLTVAVDVAPE